MHHPRLERRLGSLEHAAQLAVDRAALVEVHPLSYEGRPPASPAALAAGVAPVDRASHQRDLESRSTALDVIPARHARLFGALQGVPSRWLAAVCMARRSRLERRLMIRC